MSPTAIQLSVTYKSYKHPRNISITPFIKNRHWFNMISNQLVYNLSEVVLIYLVITKTKKKPQLFLEVVLI